jgi:shikimate dehydrogenase
VAAALAGSCGRVGALDDMSGCDIVVNATPIGMAGPLAAAVPVADDRLHPGQILIDLVYNPLETPWLSAARANGIEAHNGLSMLVFQAAQAFAQWTGRAAPVAAMFAGAHQQLSRTDH